MDGRISGVKSGEERSLSKEACAAGKVCTPVSFQRISLESEIDLGPGIKDRNPTVARFALSSPTPPKLNDMLLVAERIHLALVELSNGSSIFTGCDELGKPLQGNAHAYILPESNQALGKGMQGEITHITIFAPAGFHSREIKSIEELNTIWGNGLDIRLILLGVGLPKDFGGLDIAKGQSALMAESKYWVSRTPFIPTRHCKVTRAGVPKLDLNGLQKGSPEHDLRRLLRLNGLPDPVAIEPVSCIELAGEKVRWQRFRKERSSGKGRHAGNLGYGFKIRFPEPVQGPVVVGYGAHFGLGMFVAEREVLS